MVALSSAEAEFTGMVRGICELLWLKRLLIEIGFATSSEMDLFCDNMTIIQSNMTVLNMWKWVEISSNRISKKR